MEADTPNKQVLYSRPVTYLLIALYMLGAMVLLWHFDKNEDALVETMALENAQVQTDLLTRFRTVYTSEVVAKAREEGLTITHDYDETAGAIPLPATLTMMLGNTESGNEKGNVRSRLYSEFPFPWRKETGGLQDDFAQSAWRALQQDPNDNFYRIEIVDGEKMLRYATADRMRASCIACHNAHPDTPRKDWKEGDVRGVLEVDVPLGAVTTQAAAAMQRTLIELALVVLLGLITLTIFFRKLHKQSQLTTQYADTLHTRNTELQREVTEHAEAEEQIRDIMGRQQAIMKASVDPMATIDFDGIVLSISDSFETNMGWKREEIVGQNISVIMPEPHRSNHDTYLKNYRETGKTNILYMTREFEVVRKDGSVFPCELTVSRVDVPEQDHTFFAGIIRDITARKQVEAENVRLEEQLRQSQKMEAMGTLAGGIAHDFNNMLAAITGFTELAMLDAPKDGEQHENLEEVITAAARATDLVQQILTFSRKSEEEKRVVNLAEVIDEALRLMRPTIPSSIEVRTDLNIDVANVHADATKMHQLVVNLCTNAAGAMKNKTGVIDLSLHPVSLGDDEAMALSLEPGEYYRIDVMDTGCGIPPENIERIYDPFFTTKDVGEGTGMGLAVVHSIVRNHRGAIRIESEVGVGTTFSIFLPATDMKADASNESVNHAPGGLESILLVDDEELVVNLNTKLLTANGYKIVSTQDSTEALKFYRDDPDQFDLVISDQTMPKMRGDELADSILNINPDARIILCSGFSDTMDAKESQKRGIRRYLAKPVSTRILLQTIRQVLDE